MSFRNDSFLFFNVPGWEQLALAVPNWGESPQSQNSAIRDFVAVVGRQLQGVMFHTDAKLRTPPTINTCVRIHMLCVRARSILSSRSVLPSTPNMEPTHALPAPEEHMVFPVPYFEVENRWLKEYAGLTLLALTEALQHTENARPIEISLDFAGRVGQYFQRIYRNMAVELFQIDAARASEPTFTMTDADLKTYNPAKWFTSMEMIDNVPDVMNWPTENDLRPLTKGIVISKLPPLGRYPGAPVPQSAAAAGNVNTGAFVTAPVG